MRAAGAAASMSGAARLIGAASSPHRKGSAKHNLRLFPARFRPRHYYRAVIAPAFLNLYKTSAASWVAPARYAVSRPPKAWPVQRLGGLCQFRIALRL
jgi:hypothetical protein